MKYSETGQRKAETIRESLQQLKDKRFLAIFLLGFCSGFPWVLHGSVLTLWMQEEGLSRSAIGFIGAVATVYAINWLWAPLIDRVRLPWLHRRLGQRRSWIVFTLAGIALALLAISTGDPGESLPLISLCALMIAILSASQDIAVDAYRINIFHVDEMDAKMPFAAAVTTTGWWAGYGFIGGAIAVALGGETIGLPWPDVYRVLAFFYVILIVCVVMIAEPAVEGSAAVVSSSARADHDETRHDSEQAAAGSVTAPDARATPVDVTAAAPAPGKQSVGVLAFLQDLVVAPFSEFFKRCGLKLALSILLLLLVFRLGDAMLGRMSLVFYVEIGFSRDQIAFFQKFFGGIVTAIFCLGGALINTRFGVIRGLLVGGSAMALTNLMFALLAVTGPSVPVLLSALVLDNFTGAFATVAFISFISYFTSRTYTGTQYALMSSVSNFGRTTLAAGSGFIVDSLDGNWALFFIMTSLMVIPGLLMLGWIGRQIETYDQTRHTKSAS
ncbi:AmpG family muropeptide MFS transporter [Pseudohongiella nitratireducens]|uniref:AmpG family muropeptide MFS transporter n=1 Tax=Pseudohongiella nitratireducens TaxID=1768907 RepID=UPI0030EBF564|tara:strand:+ start:4770 stop:6266 length:1497 start_codon:yes stop_codon:yes gene_type:complete